MDKVNEQLSRILNSASRILLTGPEGPNIDIVCTAVAWAIFLSEQKKSVDVVFGGQLKKLPFLPEGVKINDKLSSVENFQIILDVSKTKVDQLSYDVEDDKLTINIVPESGTFTDSDIKTKSDDWRYDLVITVGTRSLNQLGDVFVSNRKMFEQLPVINLDNSLLNENFGQLDIVRSHATSVAEISYDLLKKYLNPGIATCLLAGMIAATNSFQSVKVKPETLAIASDLIVKGADREKIVEALYRTKDIRTLKNWGKILSRLDHKDKVIASHLHHEESDALPHYFEELVRDLILATPRVQAAVIFYQAGLDKTEAWVYTGDNVDATELAKDFEAIGDTRFVKIILDQSLDSAKEELIQFLQEKLRVLAGE